MSKLGPRQQALVDALKSGKYKKGFGCLQNKDTYCCLGVACDVAKKDGVGVYCNKDGEYEGITLSSQRKVVEYFDFYHEAGRSRNDISTDMNSNASALWAINDMSCDFSPVIKALEEHPELYFNIPV